MTDKVKRLGSFPLNFACGQDANCYISMMPLIWKL